MPDLVELLRSAEELGDATALRGAVARVDSSGLYVTIDAYDGGRQQWGPAPWFPQGGKPARGDDCLVVFDERETPWVAVLTRALPWYVEGDIPEPDSYPNGTINYVAGPPERIFLRTSAGWKSISYSGTKPLDVNPLPSEPPPTPKGDA